MVVKIHINLTTQAFKTCQHLKHANENDNI